MSDKTEIEQILAIARRNPADTTEFLLGTICNDVRTIKDNQSSIKADVEKLKQQSWFIRGGIAVASLLGGAGGAKILAWLGGLH